MPAFFFDQYGARAAGGILPPATAIAGLRGEVNYGWDRLCYGLINVSGGQSGYGRSINLCLRRRPGDADGDAVLMMGTTPELQAEVDAAIADQVNGVFVQDDYFAIYYLRYAERTFVSTTNRTVACIAGRRYYWRVPDDQNDANVQNAGWALLYPNGGTDQWMWNYSMPLQTLRQVLGRLHNTESWYNERGEWIGG